MSNRLMGIWAGSSLPENPTRIGNHAGNPDPASFTLYQNHPNPFNPSTRIEYDVKEPCNVHLMVSNIRGQTVKTIVDSYRQPGKYIDVLDMNGLPSGIYFYMIRMGEFQDVTKMVKID